MRTAFFTVLLALSVSSLPAQAHGRHGRHHHYRGFVEALGAGLAHMLESEHNQVVAHPSGCPRVAFCGCGTSERVFGHPVPNLYLANNWRRFPRSYPAPGHVAIFGRHHVAYIEEMRGNGAALLYDPNSGGHRTRIHVRSLRGATIVDPRA